MLGVKERGILSNIVEHCIRIEETISGLEKDDFDKSKDIQDVVCFNIFQIGALSKHLSPDFIAEYHAVPWQSIKGMRDIIGHGYGTIDMIRVWKTATQDIQPLKIYCQSILKNN